MPPPRKKRPRAAARNVNYDEQTTDDELTPRELDQQAKKRKREDAIRARRNDPLKKLDPALKGWPSSTYKTAVDLMLQSAEGDDANSGGILVKVRAAQLRIAGDDGDALTVANALKDELRRFLSSATQQRQLMSQEYSSLEMGLLGAAMLAVMGHDAVRETTAARAEKQLEFSGESGLDDFATHIDSTDNFGCATSILVNADGPEKHREIVENVSDDFAV